MLADLRDALRQLRKAPGFTATVVITLALGIGATTAIFTLVHQVMLKSLPVAKPDELWRIGDKLRCCNWGGYTQGSDGNFSLFSWEAYKNFREHTPEFTDLAALQAGNAPLGVRRGGSQAPVDTRNGQYVSGNFFRTLGVQPWLGRLMTDADDQLGAPLVAVMSYRIWESKYGSDPSVVGANFQINGHAFTVIGVTPPGFYGAKLIGWGMPDIWLPITVRVGSCHGCGASQTSQRKLSRPAGQSAPRSQSAGARGQTSRGVPRLAGQPRGGHGAGRETALAATDASPGTGGSGCGGDARGVQGRAEAAADRSGVRSACGLRQPRKSHAGARIEKPGTDLGSCRTGRFAASAGAQGAG